MKVRGHLFVIFPLALALLCLVPGLVFFAEASSDEPGEASSCVIVQRGTFGETMDGYIWSATPGAGYNHTTLYTGLVGSGEKRTLVRFGLDFLPPGAVVRSATFGISKISNDSGEVVAVYRVTEPWSEGEPTWDTFADSYEPSVEWGGFVAQGSGPMTTTVTGLVALWVEGSLPNYGLVLISSPGHGYDAYWSSEAARVEDRPWLEVCYVVNRAPAALDDEATTAEETPVEVDVLANDSDPDGDPLAVGDYDALSVQGGVVDCASGGMCAYTPPPNFQGTDVFTYTAADGRGGTATAAVSVTVVDAPSSIAVSKVADPASLPEPGSAVSFTVRVVNTSAVDDVTLVALTDSIHGDLNGRGDCSIPQTVFPGGAYECSFAADVSGNAGEGQVSVVTVEGSDDDGSPVHGDDDATVTIYDVPPDIAVTKTAEPDVVRAGERVDFSICVYNHSVEPVTLTDLDDPALGDLRAACGLPADIAIGGFIRCTIGRTLDDDHTSAVMATAEDDEGNQVTASAGASVDVIHPAILVVWEASPAQASVGQAVVYTCTVTNVGDVALMDVRAVDSRLGAIPLGRTTLGPGESANGSVTYVVSAHDLPGPIVSTVTATGMPPLGADVTDADTVMLPIQPASTPMPGTIYLPLVRNDPVVSPVHAPDLVVERIIATSGNVWVVIKNQGDEPVLPEEAFWVDLYINPSSPPTAVNQTWAFLCDEGLVWGVPASALPLGPGDTLTLTIGDAYYWPGQSSFSGFLPSDAAIYVQVDSANTATIYGAVLEGHEITGGPYNNVSGPVYPGAGMGEGWPKAGLPIAGGRAPAPPHSLPPRP